MGKGKPRDRRRSEASFVRREDRGQARRAGQVAASLLERQASEAASRSAAPSAGAQAPGKLARPEPTVHPETLDLQRRLSIAIEARVEQLVDQKGKDWRAELLKRFSGLSQGSGSQQS